MGIAREPSPARLFLAIMYVREELFNKVIEECCTLFGQIDRQCGPLQVSSYTDYYNMEMGTSILKRYCTFQKPVARDALAEIKTKTNDIEAKYSDNGNRMINCDPGYITNDKLVLATTKDFYHRIYLTRGIFAEVTLHYRKGKFRHFSWTYPDYRNSEVQYLCEQARARLVNELRKTQSTIQSDK